MKIKTKVWLEKEGRLVFGSGKALILQSIRETGSISKAAKKANMSYRRAWSHVNEIEKRLGIRLIERTKGGKGGGGAQLTCYAENLVERYNRLKKAIEEFADRKGKEIFSG